MRTKVKIVEQYLNYSPPVEVYSSIRLLLRHVPEEHLEGLQKIVLTNSASLLESFKGKYPAGERRIRAADARGIYLNHKIALVMDKILNQYPEVLLLLPMFKTYAIGEVLYHEIGHHIHRREQPGYRANKEEVADEWRDKLLKDFLWKRYWYLAYALRPYVKLVHPQVLKLMPRLARR